jgi:hypothetical protein
MIIAKIDEDRFLDLIRHSSPIAFQKLEFGYAIAAPSEAYYAPTNHPGGGNLDSNFGPFLATACLSRMSQPHLRTLRPTSKPIPTQALVTYLQVAFFAPSVEPMSAYPKAAGDHPAVVDSECQVVIQAIEEHGRPDLIDAMIPAKRDVMSDAIDAVIEHSEAVRELAEVGDYKPHSIQFHLLQASRALQTCLSLLLKP